MAGSSGVHVVSESLVGEVAQLIGHELSLSKPNQVMAKAILGFALQHKSSTEAFVTKARDYGRFSTTFLENLHARVLRVVKEQEQAAEARRLASENASHRFGSTHPAPEGFSGNVDRLPPPKQRKGGLVVSKGESHTFIPGVSRLGLDRLASERRQAERQKEGEKEESEQRDTKRQFRRPVPDTPSQPGGVDEDALKRIRERDQRHRGIPVRSQAPQRPPRHKFDGPPTPWETAADSVRHPPISRHASTPLHSSEPQFKTQEEQDEWEDEERRLDRAWYDQDEGGFLEEEALSEDVELREREAKMKEKAGKGGTAGQRRFGPKHNAMMEDNDRWEENRLLRSGIARRPEIELHFEDESETHVQIMVHHTIPPFLDGRYTFSTQEHIVLPVRDTSSELAKIARHGSRLVRTMRTQYERRRLQKGVWQVGGSRMGDAMGVKKSDERQGPADAKDRGEDDVDDGDVEIEGGKGSSQFAKHLKKSVAVSHFARTKTMRQQRESLPIFKIRDELMTIVRDNQIVVIVGETGSGKTTQITQFLHEEGFTDFGVVGCTQPRRVAAVSVAQRVSEEMGVKLGNEVGYSIRFEDVTSEKTVIKYMTDGLLLRESLTDSELEKYSVIVMDEAHERSLNTDVLFGILKGIVQQRTDLKLIVTSATMDADKFSRFYGGVPIYHIPGRSYPVDIMHHRKVCDDYVEETVKQVLNIHLSHPPGDILVFMTGQEDIDCTCMSLAERLAEVDGAPSLDILPIYSQLASDLQARVFLPSPDGNRKVIVATNIAETSLTVDGIIYVVDSGYCKLKVFNPKIGMDSLQVYPIAKANAAQRAGRAGRTAKGYCYRMYTELAFRTELLENAVPEIQRTNLAHVVLLLKSLHVDDLLTFEFMDPPPQANLVTSMFELWTLGALSSSGELTPMGRRMVDFPLDPAMAKMLLEAQGLGCTEEVLTIVSMMSVQTPYWRPRDREEEADSAREKLCVAESDHLTLLNTYVQWRLNKSDPDWCTEHFVHAKVMRKARETRAQLEEVMKEKGMDLVSCGQDWDVVRQAITSSLFVNAARLRGVGEYQNLRSGVKCALHPSSALYGIGTTPEYVVYQELVLTTKEYMRTVTVVDPSWLVRYGAMFFSIKDSYQDRLRKRHKEKAMEVQLEKEFDEEQRQKEEAATAEAASRSVREDRTASWREERIVTPGFGRRRMKTPRRVGM